ncbi:ATP-binding cassette sub-family A member 17 [Eurosta solidaginis]|uniref:ATP-binding cassette sub-family A member 17 n=1 Tax=Eurosta solidaginis TaxID=178769 RepID=UPI0035309930
MPASIKTIMAKYMKFELRSPQKTIAEVLIIIICYILAVLYPGANTRELSDEEVKMLTIHDTNPLENFNILQSLLADAGHSMPTNLLFSIVDKHDSQIHFEKFKMEPLTELREYTTQTAMLNRFNTKNDIAAVTMHEVSPTRLNISIHFPSKFRTIESDRETELLWAIRCNGIYADDIDNKKLNLQDLYIREGFVQLQHQLFLYWLQQVLKNNGTVNVTVKTFRQHTGWKVCTSRAQSYSSNILYSFSFFLPFLNLLWRFGREREDNILAHHWRYGFKYWQYWMGNCIISYIHLLLLDAFILVLVLIPFEGQFEGTAVQIIIYLMIYNIALLTAVIFVVSISNKAYHAVLFGAVIWLTMFSLFSILVEFYRHMTPLLFISFIGFFNNGFCFGMRELQRNEESFYPILSMIACCIFYWILISLTEYFHPGRYIKTLDINLFWFGYFIAKMHKKLKQSKDKNKKPIYEKTLGWENLEFGNYGNVEMMRLKNIHTEINSEGVRLKNITMRIYANEISVLLGPHCSGKTTTIQIAAGWKRPTLGSVQIDGKDLYDHWHEYRSQIDVCMSNNILFDLLTAEETLVYYLNVKLPKFDGQRINMELDTFFAHLKPAHIERKILVRNLDFSQKRLLNLCCTLAGGTKIVLFDEPTLHMFGKDQRLFWRILHKEKYGRAILMTTFDAAEADAVGDRVAIIGEGSLLAYGTPFFLRIKFGFGIDLIIVKSATTSTEAITELIHKFIPGIIPENEIGELLYYKLPIEMRPKFQNMLIHLEKEQKLLGIVDMRAISSDLAEVYMTLSTRNTKQVIRDDKNLQYELIPPKELPKQQTYALLNKKLIQQASNYIPLIAIGVSIFCMLLVAAMAKYNLQLPSKYHSMRLGFVKNLDLTEYSNCKLVYIKSVRRSKFLGDNSMMFHENSFGCVNMTYEEYLRGSKNVKNKFGAVQINDDNNYELWINQRIFHSAPLVLNLMHNLYLGGVVRDSSPLHPMANSPQIMPLRERIHLIDQDRTHLLLPLVFGVAIPITLACFIIPLVDERKYHLLTLQKLAGVSMTRYWLVNLIWDISTFFCYTIVFTIILALSPVEGYSFSDKLYTMLIINIYGFSGIGLIYVLSLYFYWSIWSTYLIAVLIQIITGLFSYILFVGVFDASDWAFYMWAIFPTFSLMEGISSVYTHTKEEMYCDEACKDDDKCNKNDMCNTLPQCCLESIFKFHDPGILWPILFMTISAIIIFIILYVIEHVKARNRFSTKRDVRTLRSATHPYDDREVMQLKQHIAHQDLESSIRKRFMVDQLEYKIPKKGDTLNTISFLAEPGQCIAIYGSRHSNKSYFAGQVVGENTFAFGDVFVDGAELKYEPEKAFKKLSYVPQDHGLWNSFTPRQILRFFCLLRGIEYKNIRPVLRDLSSAFSMGSYMDKPIMLLSVDRRRKVNIALALIAHPTVVILDEPTRGLTPKACREVWNVLRYKRYMGKTLIITTTDEHELEALSDRLLIYNRGEMWAYGNIQNLRIRYTKGFFLYIKLRIEGSTAEEAKDNLYKDSNNLVRFVTFLHEDSELQVRIDNCFKFYLPVPIVSYSFLYGSMEKNKRRLNISDYCVSQGTLLDAADAIEAFRNKKTDGNK